MIDIQTYLYQLLERSKQQFGTRLVYVGLQGSHLRGEAGEQSDIDIMLVIDGLSLSDLDDYRAILQSLGAYDRSCGFVCSKHDLANWNPLEICNLLYSTKDLYGTLKTLVPDYTQEDIRNFVKLSINNLYHEICHRYIHSGQTRSFQALPGVYKGVFFILQNLHYLRSGCFARTKAELLALLSGKDREVLERCMRLTKGEPCDLPESLHLLFSWCQETLACL